MWFKGRTYDPEEGIVLTDDFNPVEFHDRRNRDDNRRALIKSVHPQ
jgi:hypothetical protein